MTRTTGPDCASIYNLLNTERERKKRQKSYRRRDVGSRGDLGERRKKNIGRKVVVQ